MNALTDNEFDNFRRFILDAAGLSLSPAKKALVSGRLAKRLQVLKLASYSEYFALLKDAQDPDEVQTAIDLLTTNETYFFREPRHFDFLRSIATAARPGKPPLRVWSAACSSGEEAYSMAMVLVDCLNGGPFQVTGTDISVRMLRCAHTGHYPEQRTQHIPPAYLKRFCLRGMGNQAGTLLVDRSLRQHVSFLQANLNAPLPDLGSFDVIFLRNVMIYFSIATKREVVGRVLANLKPGGYFCVGHTESLNDVSSAVTQLAPSIYRKP